MEIKTSARPHFIDIRSVKNFKWDSIKSRRGCGSPINLTLLMDGCATTTLETIRPHLVKQKTHSLRPRNLLLSHFSRETLARVHQETWMFIATQLEIIKNTSTTWRTEACRAALTGILHSSEKKWTAFMPESQKRPEFKKKKKPRWRGITWWDSIQVKLKKPPQNDMLLRPRHRGVQTTKKNKRMNNS